jgi:methanogenic corrinoid protein MtbC1
MNNIGKDTSLTIIKNLDNLARMAVDDSARILVGGAPFNVDRALWQKVAADGYAPNAQEAALTATALSEGTL